MALQSIVNTKQAVGVIGDFYDDSPRRVMGKNLNASAGGALPTVGNAFTYSAVSTDPTQVVMGGTGAFAGILVNGKELVRSNGLEAGLTVADNSIGSICTMGHVWVKVDATIQVGYIACYNTTTGSISGIASGSAPSGYELIPNAKFVAVNANADGLAVIELNW
jgi:hypothetical protein